MTSTDIANQNSAEKYPRWARVLEKIGSPVAEQLDTFQSILLLFAQTFRRLFVRPWRWSEIMSSIVQIGIGSLPIITISTAFAGMVITNEIAYHLDKSLHTVSMIPGSTGQLIWRELGIAIPALLLVAKVGAAITAEVGTMKITEQIDALKLLGIDPISYLVFPRFIASVFSGLCLTLIAAFVTMTCAIAVAVFRYNFSLLEYINALRHFIGFGDLICAIVKGMVFGALIPVISCGYGFRCKGGAEGVGTATTNSVVASTIAVIVVDFILTYVFTMVL